MSQKIKQENFSNELYQVFMCQIVLNVFYCIFWGKMSQKLDKKKSELYLVAKCFNTFILYTFQSITL